MKITYEDVVEQVAKIVAEKGRDHVYANKNDKGDCFYFRDEAPSCVVGHWVHALGIEEFESAVKFKESSGPFPAGELVTAAWDKGIDIEIDEAALMFLSNMQSLQDGGWTWGAALDFAIDQAESGNI